ncbi:MAG: flippase [Desulfobacterales bacterium]
MKLPFLNKLDHNMQEVVQGASVALVVKILAAGLGFILNVVLARLLGPEGTGLYFLALTVTTVAAVLGRAGLDKTFVRFTASNSAVGNWGAIRGLYRKGIKLALGGLGITAGVLLLLAPWLANTLFSEPKLTSLIRCMAIAVVPFGLFVLHANLLQGLKRIRDAILVLSVCLPAFSLPGVIILVPVWNVQGAVLAYALAAFLTLLVGLWRWRKATPQLGNFEARFQTSELLQSSIPLFWVAALQLVITWSSNLMLGIWASSVEVGLFSIANRTAMLTSFILMAVNSIAAPKFAALYAQGDMEALGSMARNSARLMTLIAMPLLFLFLFASGWIMAIFGKQFAAGGLVLSILAVGQFVNVITGSVGFVLMMCGYEGLLRNNLAFCAFINLALNYLLIPSLGAIGAAIATATTLILQNLIAAGLVWWRLGIMTIPLIPVKSRHGL